MALRTARVKYIGAR